MPIASRTDVHRPVELTPEDYTEVGWYDLGGGEDEPPMMRLSAEARQSDEVWVGVHGSVLERCDHCGANHLRYGVELVHIPTSGHIHVGETCLAHRFSLSKREFRQMRKDAKLNRQAVTRREAFVAANDENRLALQILEERQDQSEFLRSLWACWRRYGELSQSQVEAVLRIPAQETERVARIEAEHTQYGDPIPAPWGRVEVTGEVLSLKVQESDWGATLKMLMRVRVEAGHFKVWSSVPAGAREIEPGCTVTMKVTLEQSSKDASFAFGKRPTLLSFQSAQEAG